MLAVSYTKKTLFCFLRMFWNVATFTDDWEYMYRTIYSFKYTKNLFIFFLTAIFCCARYLHLFCNCWSLGRFLKGENCWGVEVNRGRRWNFVQWDYFEFAKLILIGIFVGEIWKHLILKIWWFPNGNSWKFRKKIEEDCGREYFYQKYVWRFLNTPRHEFN